MAKTDIIGSWFKSGYHGHFRSKSRNDFICEYRQLAKPQPPNIFYKRSKEPVVGHIFSKHDNRHSFMNDALYFEQGLGRKRIQSQNSNRFNGELLTWMPQKKELENAGPKKSMYKVDYRGKERMAEQIVKRPKTSFDNDCSSITTYRYAHGDANPNRHLISAMSNDGFAPSATTKIKKFTGSKETVASCLSWNGRGGQKRGRMVPAATEISIPEVHPMSKRMSDTAPAVTQTTAPSPPMSVPATAPHPHTATYAAL